MSDEAQWNLIVSRDTGKSLRQFLARQGSGREDELSDGRVLDSNNLFQSNLEPS